METTFYFWAWAERTGNEAIMPELWACFDVESLSQEYNLGELTSSHLKELLSLF